KAGSPDRPVNDVGYTHICVTVDDIEAEYARLTALGIPFHCSPRHAAGLCKATYLRDPDGNIVELMEPEPGGPFVI
ncbi:MAG: VOC family protein, partial [Alphaproteobacteria bacterium]|nr:VOC family protein [Alphaproteobacteria bacterium]